MPWLAGLYALACEVRPEITLERTEGFRLTRKLAVELGPFGIRCNAAAPGVTRTERMERLLARRSEAEREAMVEAVPLRRLATPGDVAAVVAFLASDEAGFVSGHTVQVTGGQ